MAFQMGEQHLDLFASSSDLIELPRVTQITDRLANFLVHMARDRAVGGCRARFADRTIAAGCRVAEVAFDPCVLVRAAQGQIVALKTGVWPMFRAILSAIRRLRAPPSCA